MLVSHAVLVDSAAALIDNLGHLTITHLPQYFGNTLDLLDGFLRSKSITSAGPGSKPTRTQPPSAKRAKAAAVDDVKGRDEDADQSAASETNRASDSAVAALSVVLVAIRKLPAFLSPFTARILRCVFHPAVCDSISVRTTPAQPASTELAKSINTMIDDTSAGSTAAADASADASTVTSTAAVHTNGELAHITRAVFTALVAQVPARLLLPALFQSFPHVLAQSMPVPPTAANDSITEAASPVVLANAAPLVQLFQFLGSVCSRLSEEEVETHYRHIFKFLLAGFDLRRRLTDFDPQSSARVPESTVRAVEEAVCTCFVALVLRLSEAQLKPVFMKLISWLGFSGTLFMTVLLTVLCCRCIHNLDSCMTPHAA